MNPDPRVVPFKLKNAARFADYAGLRNPLPVIRVLRATPEIWEPLRDAVETDLGGRHRPRGAGYWELAYLGFVMSGFADVQFWWDGVRADRDFWDVCGFDGPPSGWNTWHRFKLLEEHEAAFQDAASALVKKAKQFEPAIGWWMHVDSTSAQTHGQLTHACEDVPGHACPTAGSKRPPRLEHLSGTATQTVRQQVNEMDPEEAEQLTSAETRSSRALNLELTGKRPAKHFEIGGHYWRSMDPDAGTRQYRSAGKAATRVWHGYYVTQFIDHVTGMPVMSRLASASTNEHKIYLAEADRMHDVIGHWPVAVAADKGFSIESVYEFNSRRKITTVMPYRTSKKDQTPPTTSKFDVDGVPLCPGCGVPGDHVWSGPKVCKGGEPVAPFIRFKCSMPSTPECNGQHQVACSENWRRLIPIWRTSQVFAELEASHSNEERVHRAMRDAFLVGPTSASSRPKRVGLPCQQLRATAAVLVTWLRLGLVHGWITPYPEKAWSDITYSPSGKKLFESRRRARAEAGLLGGGYLSRERRVEPTNRPVILPNVATSPLPPMSDDLPTWHAEWIEKLVDAACEQEAAKKAALRKARKEIGAKRLASHP